MTFGERLIQLRKENKLTRDIFAETLGISKYTLRNYELSINEPSTEFLIQISKHFNVSMDYLLGLTEERNIYDSFHINESEYETLKKYRLIEKISPEGKATVDFILNREFDVAQKINDNK